MVLIYIAGPYRAAHDWERQCRIHRARERGAAVAQLGAFPVVPHANTANYDGLKPDAFWLDGDLELMRRCDAVMLVEGWRESEGTCAEIRAARGFGLPIFLALADLADWLAAREAASSSLC